MKKEKDIALTDSARAGSVLVYLIADIPFFKDTELFFWKGTLLEGGMNLDPMPSSTSALDSLCEMTVML